MKLIINNLNVSEKAVESIFLWLRRPKTTGQNKSSLETSANQLSMGDIWSPKPKPDADAETVAILASDTESLGVPLVKFKKVTKRFLGLSVCVCVREREREEERERKRERERERQRERESERQREREKERDRQRERERERKRETERES